jgi:hypothetical protein
MAKTLDLVNEMNHPPATKFNSSPNISHFRFSPSIESILSQSPRRSRRSKLRKQLLVNNQSDLAIVGFRTVRRSVDCAGAGASAGTNMLAQGVRETGERRRI